MDPKLFIDGRSAAKFGRIKTETDYRFEYGDLLKCDVQCT